MPSTVPTAPFSTMLRGCYRSCGFEMLPAAVHACCLALQTKHSGTLHASASSQSALPQHLPWHIAVLPQLAFCCKAYSAQTCDSGALRTQLMVSPCQLMGASTASMTITAAPGCSALKAQQLSMGGVSSCPNQASDISCRLFFAQTEV